MTIPSFLLAFVIASLYGALYHLWRGGGPGRILFYLVLAWFGFLGANFLATWQAWHLLPIGSVDIGIGTLGALISLFLGDWLALTNTEQE
ncbi:MAG: hypothetical protein HN855_11085 [Anaerolineae bacterium]|jgi:hypothetical protein|nr:hypothetical protein [Anaerolineae bacterium]MBT7069984.1 hypothetical protein [Anaerolineae bacterium]MBT7325696.1 hypothetical protein [Anaerolineae bacterium]